MIGERSDWPLLKYQRVLLIEDKVLWIERQRLLSIGESSPIDRKAIRLAITKSERLLSIGDEALSIEQHQIQNFSSN